MYFPLINVGYVLFTACMTLAGMLASDPQGALIFVSTLPLPFASNLMLLAPAFAKLQRGYVLQPLDLMELSSTSSSGSIRSVSRVSSPQPADLANDYWYRYCPVTPPRLQPVWDSDASPFPTDFLRDFLYPSETLSSSTPPAKTDSAPKSRKTFVATDNESTSLDVRTLIQSQSSRTSVLMIPALLFFGTLFVVRMSQRVVNNLLRCNIDEDYDLDLEQDDPCKFHESQSDDISPSTTVSDATITGISVPPTVGHAAVEAISPAALNEYCSTNQDSNTLVGTTLLMAARDVLEDNTCFTHASARFRANATLLYSLGPDVGRDLNTTGDLTSDEFSTSHICLNNGTFTSSSISAVIPARGTLPATSPSPAACLSSGLTRHVQGEAMVIGEPSFKSPLDVQCPFVANATADLSTHLPIDDLLPDSLDSSDVGVPLGSVDVLAQGQQSRFTPSNVGPSTNQSVQHITHDLISAELRDPSTGPSINTSSTSASVINDHISGTFVVDDLISGISTSDPAVSNFAPNRAPSSLAMPISVVIDGKSVCPNFSLSLKPNTQDGTAMVRGISSSTSTSKIASEAGRQLNANTPTAGPSSTAAAFAISLESKDHVIIRRKSFDDVSQILKTEPRIFVIEAPICPATRPTADGVRLVEFQDPSSGKAISIPLGSDSIDRGAIPLSLVGTLGTVAGSDSPARRKRPKPTKNQRMARNAARVYDIVLPFGDVDDLAEVFGRVKVKVQDIQRACAEANEMCRQRRSRLQGHRVPYAAA